MIENSWNFSIKQKEEAVSYYLKNGVVGFHDLINLQDLYSILNGINEAIKNDDLIYNDADYTDQNDLIFSHPILENYVKDKRICNITRDLLGIPIELQHARLQLLTQIKKIIYLVLFLLLLSFSWLLLIW